MTGPGSTAERTRLPGKLLCKATREEHDFLARLILGELRQGAVDVIDMVAKKLKHKNTDHFPKRRFMVY
ncbi:MAG: hypothetical protein KAT27_01250 [Desulfobacterales bacterium]|nr:hypothetical protein [Desulfobacterales bacterium]